MSTHFGGYSSISYTKTNVSRETRLRFSSESTHPVRGKSAGPFFRDDELLVIAGKLKVSRRTVENRRSRIMKKLKVTTFPALVAMAVEYEKFSPVS